MPVNLLSLPAELLLELCNIADALLYRERSPSSLLKQPKPSSVIFELPTTLTPNSAPFTPLGPVAGEHVHTTTIDGDYFGMAGHGVEGLVPNGGSLTASVANDMGVERDLMARRTPSLPNAVSGHTMPQRRKETLHAMSCVCKELRSIFWPVLSNTITLDLPKIQEILRLPTKYTFASGVRHLQVNLYPSDPTSLDNVSTFLAIISIHLYSLRFRFHPLPHSNANARVDAGSTNKELDLSTPYRKVFHLPRVRQDESRQDLNHASSFPHLSTFEFSGFGAISTLETSILQQAPNLATLDVASHPFSLSKTFDLVETLHSCCPALRNLRLEIDLELSVKDLTVGEYYEYWKIHHVDPTVEIITLLSAIFQPRITSGKLNSARECSMDESFGSLSNLRKVDILCKGFCGVLTLVQWDLLAKVIISAAPQLRSLTLPITPEFWPRFNSRDSCRRDREDRRQARRPWLRNILGRIVKLDANSRIDSRTKADEDSSELLRGRVGIPGEVLLDLEGFSHRLEHLEYLEFKLYTRQDRKLYDPLIHVDDHPFHSRVLPAERKVDVDPGRKGAWVPESPERVERVVINGIILRPSPREPGSQRMRWQPNGELLECEVYKVWSASFERIHNSPKHPKKPLSECATGEDGTPMQDVVLERNHHSAGYNEAERYGMEIKTRLSVHQRW